MIYVPRTSPVLGSPGQPVQSLNGHLRYQGNVVVGGVPVEDVDEWCALHAALRVVQGADLTLVQSQETLSQPRTTNLLVWKQEDSVINLSVTHHNVVINLSVTHHNVVIKLSVTNHNVVINLSVTHHNVVIKLSVTHHNVVIIITSCLCLHNMYNIL